MIKFGWPNEFRTDSISTEIDDPTKVSFSDYGFNQTSSLTKQIAESNRDRLLGDLGVSHIQWMRQVHGDLVFEANPSADSLPEADACWTKQVGVGLGVVTADCLPVVIASRKGDWLGIAHAGWRGLAKGILAELVGCADVEVGELVSWIGPAISCQRYEVGQEVWSVFNDIHSYAYTQNARSDELNEGKRFLDLHSIAESQLQASGIDHVYRSGICTYDDPRFFSVRKRNHSPIDMADGRLATVALLKR